MEHPFEKYYQTRPSHDIINDLSDPCLDTSYHRDQVNTLVMSLVIQYLGEYLKVPSPDPRLIGEAARRAKAKIEQDRMRDQWGAKMLQGTLDGDLNAGRTNDDAPGLKCLLDTASTAALFKELAFMECSTRAFVGADFGSGTGILTLATVIAGRRSRTSAPFTLAFEREAVAVQKAKEVFQRLGISNGEARFQKADVRTPGLISTHFHGLPLSLWVCEGISDHTPSMELRAGAVVHTGEGMKVLGMQWINRATEPFFEVLQATLRERPDFLQNLREGESQMFPNLVSGAFVPNGEKGATLKLQTSPMPDEAKRLPTLGVEFWAYEQPVPESIQDPSWARFPDRNSSE